MRFVELGTAQLTITLPSPTKWARVKKKIPWIEHSPLPSPLGEGWGEGNFISLQASALVIKPLRGLLFVSELGVFAPLREILSSAVPATLRCAHPPRYVRGACAGARSNSARRTAHTRQQTPAP